MLHGRQHEQRVLGKLIADAEQHRGGALVLRGRPGVGKTALLAEAAGRAPHALVLPALGVEGDAQLAFSGAQQVLGALTGKLGRIPAPQAAALGVALGLRAGRGAGPQDPFLVAVGTLSLLSAAAEERLVVVVVDDAHWLDDASAQALAFAARRAQHERLAFLFAAREGDVRTFDSRGLPELRVEGLDTAAAQQLLGERVGVPVPAAVVHRLVEETAGSPLALTELPSVLSTEQLGGRAPLPATLPLPGGVQGVFLERVRRLPAATQALLLIAAADDSGRLDAVLQAAKVLELDPAGLDAAEETGLVSVIDGHLRFRHPLVRSAVLQGATSRQRREAHRALAEVLGGDADAERRAWHRAAAAPGRDETIAAELEQAAAGAARRGGFESASVLLQRAADLTPESEDRARRLATAAQQAWRGGQLQLTASLLEGARALARHPVLRADVDRLRAWVEMTSGSANTALALLLQASRDVLALAHPGAFELVAAAAETAWVLQDRLAAGHLSELPLPAPRADSPREQFFHASIGGFQALFDGDIRTGAALLRDGMAIAERSGDTPLLASAGHAAFHVGDDAAAHRLNAAVVARARAAGAVGEALPALTRLTHADFLVGRWNAATASAAEARRLAGETRQVQLGALPSAWLAVLAAHRGDDAAFESAVTQTTALADAHPLGVFDGLVRDVLAWARAVHLMAHGHAASALGWLAEVSHPPVAQLAALDRIEAALHADEAKQARSWLTQFEDFATSTGAAWAEARVAHCRALLAEPGQAQEHFDAALDRHSRSQRSFERARTALAYGRYLRRNRRRVLARTQLRAAHDLFESHGAAYWAEQASLELRASGQTARKRTPATVADLTPQELQVARHVAQGLPTKEVAAQLFLSPRTVEFHLRNVFSKLGIVSRVELANLQLDS